MRRLGFVVLAVVVTALGGCSSESDASSSPCEQFTTSDARSLLGTANVERVPYERFFAERATETTTAEGTEAAKKLSKTTCAYQVGDEVTAAAAVYQYGFADTKFFSSEAKFLEANLHDGDEEVSGVGEAAVYSPTKTADKGTSLTVLLTGGRNFVVATYGTDTPRAKLVAAAKRIADRA